MSHEPGGPNSDHQEPGVPTSDHFKIVLKNIHHIKNQNKITVLFNNITRKMDMIQKWNSLNQEYMYNITLCRPFINHSIIGIRLS